MWIQLCFSVQSKRPRIAKASHEIGKTFESCMGFIRCHLPMFILLENVGSMGPLNRREINAQLMDAGYIFFMIRVNCDNHATPA